MTFLWTNITNRPLQNNESGAAENAIITALPVFPCVHPSDTYPVSLIKPNMESGPWIAGGAALSWYNNQPVDSDIDVFCSSEQQANEVVDRLYNINKSLDLSRDSIPLESSSQIYQSPNARTFRVYNHDHSASTSWAIQVIFKRFFSSLQDAINSFDITVCQIGTDGYRFVLGDCTARHIKQKKLHFVEPLRPDTVKRLVKYWSYGYEPDPNLIDKIVAAKTDFVWKFNRSLEEYENAFNTK